MSEHPERNTSDSVDSPKAKPPYLYFAADLSHVLLSLPGQPPGSLWFRPRGETASVAVWLLTTATFARIMYQFGLLDSRNQAGDYPDERLAEVRDRLRPIIDYALAHMAPADCHQAIDNLKRIGGPTAPLPQPEPLPPSPFDDPPAKPIAAPRWNGSRMRWKHTREGAS